MSVRLRGDVSAASDSPNRLPAHVSRVVHLSAQEHPRPAGFGMVPLISTVQACGLLVVAIGNSLARSANSHSLVVWWVGMLLVFVPVAARQLSVAPSRAERATLAATLGLSLYLAKVLQSPLYFSSFDEFLHVRTATNILVTHHLFGPNPLFPISPLYPGLEITTSALMSATGLGVLPAGLVVVGVARLVLVLGLFLLYEHVSGSARIAGIGTTLYACNQGFLFFDAHYSYESLALPLAVVALYAAGRELALSGPGRLGFGAVGLLLFGATVVTHHVTGFMLASFLLVWTLACHVRHARGPAALLAVTLVLSWLVYAASLTVGYLAATVGGGIRELVMLIEREETARQFFVSSSGQIPPLAERLVGYSGVVVILLALPFGLRWTWRRLPGNSLAQAFAVASLAFPASLLLRLTPAGAGPAIRSVEFVFVPLSFVLAFVAVSAHRLPLPGTLRLALRRRLTRKRRTLVLVFFVTIIFAGGVALSEPPWIRLPGPYLVIADERSIEPQGIAAAAWARAHLGPSNALVADRINRVLMGTYGMQRPVIDAYGGIPAADVVLDPALGSYERRLLRLAKVGYVVVDYRIVGEVPELGVYFEPEEPGALHHRTDPATRAELDKFNHVRGIGRVYDGGSIVVYDVRRLSGAR